VCQFKNLSRLLYICLITGTAVISSMPAHAEDTLARIARTHTINIGVRANAAPFSSLDAKGKAMGYSIDVCHKIIGLMRKSTGIADLQAKEVRVTAEDRFKKLAAGDIDIECALTSNVKSRSQQVGFSYPILFSAQHLLINKKYTIYSQNDLDGRTVVTVKGTAGEKILSKLRETSLKKMKLIYATDNQDAIKALETGKAQAFIELEVLLQDLRLHSKDAQNLSITEWPLSVEPLAFPMRKQDTAFQGKVNDALKTLFGEADFQQIYNKWFQGKINIPISGLMRENMHNPATDSGFSLVPGVDL